MFITILSRTGEKTRVIERMRCFCGSTNGRVVTWEEVYKREGRRTWFMCEPCFDKARETARIRMRSYDADASDEEPKQESISVNGRHKI